MTQPTTRPTPPRLTPRFTRSTILALAFVAVFAYFDWIMHREVPATIVLALVAGALIVYGHALVDMFGLRDAVDAIPQRVKPVLAATPALVYFLARGQGTSDSSSVVFVCMLLVVGVSVVFGPAMDRKLAGFYRSRNRVLPQVVRVLLAVVLPVLISFLVIHGSLSDVPALFGGTTKHPQTPVGREGSFFLGTALSAAVAWLLLREGTGAAPAPAGAPSVGAPAAGAPAGVGAWRPSHVTPAQGLTAWAEPSPTAATMPIGGGVGVQVRGRTGDWVQVTAENGWTGWVDGRLLEPWRGGR